MTEKEYWEKRAKLSEAIYESFENERKEIRQKAMTEKLKDNPRVRAILDDLKDDSEEKDKELEKSHNRIKTYIDTLKEGETVVNKTFGKASPMLGQYFDSRRTDADNMQKLFSLLGIKYDYSFTMLTGSSGVGDIIRVTNALKVGKTVFYFDMGKYVGMG